MTRKQRRIKRLNFILRKARMAILKNRKEKRRRKQIRLSYCLARYHSRRKMKERMRREEQELDGLRIIAPKDLRLMNNMEECAVFFSALLDEGLDSMSGEPRSLYIRLSHVEQIDFPSAMLLAAISEELSSHKCYVCGDNPIDIECWQYLKDSGFYNRMFDKNGKRILESPKSKIMAIESGENLIDRANLCRFVDIIKQVKEHLLPGVDTAGPVFLVSMMKEICGNSVEWGELARKAWTVGVKFEEGVVKFCALDLGQGILQSLFRSHGEIVRDWIKLLTDEEILYRVFREHYASRSKENNRNQGLPFLLSLNTEKNVKDLKVVTNNVYISFANDEKIRFSQSRKCFRGTLYSWSVDADCLLK